jgi:2-keto-4-pentenoate hydratase/2-oxohepta-3-ene-1,7-dioic acid hydratase in catechol pathway
MAIPLFGKRDPFTCGSEGVIDRGYRLVTYRGADGSSSAGVLIGDKVHAADSLLSPSIRDRVTVLGILRQWPEAHVQLHAAAASAPGGGIPLDRAPLLAPIQYPGALYCAGANYWDHLAEMAEIAKRTTGIAPAMSKGAEPWFFLKTAAGSIIGPGCDARLPSFSRAVDWEAELGVVIGRRARNISEGVALEAVAGYVIVNDLSARDLMKREGTPFIYDWIGQKCFDDGAPMGPWLTPAAYAPAVDAMSVRLWVNDTLKQDSHTSRMVHGVAEQIAYLSRHVTLQPGDVIATGTPAGVGMPRGEFLQVGDEVRIEIEGCGVLRNRMVGDDGLTILE